MSIRNIVNPTRVNKTLAEWAMDATVYSENKILVSEDLFYSGTNQPRYKLANGVDTWADLDYVPAGGADTNMANDDLILDDDRTHDAAGFSWSLRDLRQLNFESTSTPSGQPAMRWEFNNGAASFSDMAFQFTTNNNASFPVLDIRGNGNVGIGDMAQSNIKVQIYTSNVNEALRATTEASAGTGIVGGSSGINGKGGSFQCQSFGGIGSTSLGQSIGFEGKVTSDNGTANVSQGCAVIKEFDDNSGRADAALLHLRSINKASILIDPITKSQRDAIAPTKGMIVFMDYFDEDEPEGLYLYKTVGGWKLILTDV